MVVLAGVSDPGNAGTVIRSAAAAGAAGVLFTPGSVDPTNPKCVRAERRRPLRPPGGQRSRTWTPCVTSA